MLHSVIVLTKSFLKTPQRVYCMDYMNEISPYKGNMIFLIFFIEHRNFTAIKTVAMMKVL